MTPQPLQTFKAGTRLIAENDTSSRKMYIIRSGKARVYKSYLGQRITLAILGEGEMFGEMSFFDAEPRSASVEALTELSVIVLDGEENARKLTGVPEWIFPIFKTVFNRFREMDRRLLVLQSTNEYQKRAFRTDNVAKTIYLEVMRIIKAMRLLYDRDMNASGKVSSDVLYGELNHVLGAQSIGLRTFWRKLKEHDFIDHAKEDRDGVLVLNEDVFLKWCEYLSAEVDSGRYLLLSHSALAVLGRLVAFIGDYNDPDENAPDVTVTFAELKMEKMPMIKEAVEELQSKNILRVSEQAFVVRLANIYPLYSYQSLLKAFDHTIVHLE